MYLLQTGKLRKDLIKVISLCKVLKVPVGLGPGADPRLPLENMENKELPLVFTPAPFSCQKPQLGQKEAEVSLQPNEERDPLRQTSPSDPVPSPEQLPEPTHCKPPWLGSWHWFPRVSERRCLKFLFSAGRVQFSGNNMFAAGCKNRNVWLW